MKHSFANVSQHYGRIGTLKTKPHYYLSILLLISLLSAQDKRLHLQQADVLKNISIDGKAIQILTGNVLFKKENMTLACDRARWSDRENKGTLAGNVIVTKEDRTLICDSLFYQSEQDIIKTFGNTHIWDTDYDLVADSLLFYSSVDSGIALGHVRLLQKTQDIRSGQMTYVKRPGEDAVSYTARDSVIIIETESGREANCGTAVYDRGNETTVLYDHPEMRDGARTLSGTSIQLIYHDEVLSYLFIPGNASATSRSTGYRKVSPSDSLSARIAVVMTNDMSGRLLKGYFIDGELDSIRLEGMAQTLYHIFEDSIYTGRNLASGDTITMAFENQELVRIHILGGARGVYTPDTTETDVSGPVRYESEQIVYRIEDGTSELTYRAVINQDVTQLSAGFIRINWDSNLLYALPQPVGDTLTPPEVPTILETGKDPMSGTEMVYNLKTRKGRVTEGRTKAADGYYQGKEIRNEGTKVFYIRNSIYTTCDLDDPHFDFSGTRMKMIQNDKVISRPLIFEIHHIPLFGLPFIILPHQGGRRHSGWIMPTYGDNKNRGQYIDGAGYYWAVNDYWDFTTKFGFADKQGFRLRNNIRYKKRYRFNGNLHLEGKWLLTPGQNDITTLRDNMQRDIVIKWNHSHTLRRNQTFRANVSYYSNGAYNYQTGIDQQERLSQKAVSNITYRKVWKKSGNSFSLNLSSNQDLMVDQKIDPTNLFYVTPTRSGTELTINSMALPNATFRLGSKNLFAPLKFLGRWTGKITTSYSASLKRNVKTYYQSRSIIAPDSSVTYDWIRNADGQGKSFSDESAGIVHTYAVTFPFKLFKYISVNPNANFKTNWVDRTYTAVLDPTTNTLIRHQKQGFASRTTGSMNLNVNTKIYGLIPVEVGKLAALRHVITPTIGYRYSPDFSKPLLGWTPDYFETIRDTAGQIIKHDRFRGTFAGATPTREQKALTFSLKNILEAKWGESGKERKINLLSVNMNTSYNYVAEVFPLVNLVTSMTSKLGNLMTINLRATHDFYQFDREQNKRIPSLRKTATGLPNPRLLTASFSTGFRFRGARWTAATIAVEDTSRPDSTVDQDEAMFGTLESRNRRSGGKGQFWTARFNINYSINQANPDNIRKTFWINSNATVNLTPSWKISYTARFNMVSTELVSHSFAIQKDLHCWEMSFNWTPTQYGGGYFLRINVKSPNLRDIKLEEKGGIYGRRSNF